MIRIKQGLDIPIAGTPEQKIHPGPAVQTVGVLGRDYHAYKRLPTLLVSEGDRVRLGQPLVRGKYLTTVTTTAPGSGVVEYIERGVQRFLETIVIRLDGDEEETFNAYRPDELAGLNAAQVRENLLASGLWLAFRTRPYSLVADPDTEPHAIFVTAIDTNPLAADPAVVIAAAAEDFAYGLTVLTRLIPGTIHVCKAAGAGIHDPQPPPTSSVTEFSGPHPAGLPGTHIHFLAPVGAQRIVWHLNYQDVIAIGRLFTTGRLSPERIVALCGPAVFNPRLLRTRLGANTNDLVRDELRHGESRLISGSILSGQQAVGRTAYLGRYHHQVCVLREGRKREFFGWMAPGFNKYSASKVFISSLFGKRDFRLTTTLNGSPRAMVPTGSFERLMPLDILPTQLLRALVDQGYRCRSGARLPGARRGRSGAVHLRRHRQI